MNAERSLLKACASKGCCKGSFASWAAIGIGVGVSVAYAIWPTKDTRPIDSIASRSVSASATANGTSATADESASVSQTDFQPTRENVASPASPAPEGMVWVPGGEFSMGSDERSEALCGLPGITNDAVPIHRVYVKGFWMDAVETTNAQFRKFVEETGYVTVAEIKPTIEEFPGAPEENLVAGSTVFSPTRTSVPLNNFFQWWSYVPGADWRHPSGPESSIEGRDNYPVVQVCYEDAVAYAKWAGKRLPTEAEWEFAARGGKSGQLYVWGNEIAPNGEYQANIYQGRFPVKDGDTAADRFAGIAPVRQYRPNAYQLYDMGGNVWEWVSDWYRHDTYARLHESGKVARNPIGPTESFDPVEPDQKKRVHRGGSFLCSDLYCARYMVGTRGKGEVRTASNHLGFRCVQDAPKTAGK